MFCSSSLWNYIAVELTSVGRLWEVKPLKAGFQFCPQIARKHCGIANLCAREGKNILKNVYRIS